MVLSVSTVGDSGDSSGPPLLVGRVGSPLTLYRLRSVSTTAGVTSTEEVFGAEGGPLRILCPFFRGSHGWGRIPFSAG
jgi:hypothetical protein